jgi:hypothetical protein
MEWNAGRSDPPHRGGGVWAPEVGASWKFRWRYWHVASGGSRLGMEYGRFGPHTADRQVVYLGSLLRQFRWQRRHIDRGVGADLLPEVDLLANFVGGVDMSAGCRVLNRVQQATRPPGRRWAPTREFLGVSLAAFVYRSRCGRGSVARGGPLGGFGGDVDLLAVRGRSWDTWGVLFRQFLVGALALLGSGG